ncbi:hypothetical protein OR1_04206 [Geobacter sp. OR-1]|nr:hypothetical protein OR1_04206 [Geobacter sp. OR-1]
MTTINSGPVTGSTTKSPVTFTFSADKADATFECKVDAGGYGVCVSPRVLTLSNGSHLFYVRSKRMTGAGTGTATYEALPPSVGWTIDTVAPTVAIVTKPGTPVNSSTVNFTFSSTGDLDHYNYKVMKGVVQVIAETSLGVGINALQLNNLTDGAYAVTVWAVDAAGNKSAVPATYNWTIQLPPETALTSTPALFSGLTTATFGFNSPNAGVTFECSLDGTNYVACVSPVTYRFMTDALHTFAVRAKNSGGVVDSSPASYSWTVDTTAPETTIISGPAAGSLSGAAVAFVFTSDKSDATFECKVDADPYAACVAPLNLTLAAGPHTFYVRAKRMIGAGSGTAIFDFTPAQVSWTVN